MHIEEVTTFTNSETSVEAFAICGLPVEDGVAVQMFNGTDSTDAIVARVPKDGVLTRDLEFGRRSGRMISLATIALDLKDADGRPVAEARVSGTSAPLSARSDANGHVALSTSFEGTQSITIRAIGFAPLTIAVESNRVGDSTRTIRLSRTPNVLVAVTVTAARSYKGFKQRMQAGRGIFMDSVAILNRRAFTFSSLMERLPGVVSLGDREFSPRFLVKSGRQQCEPTIFVDGIELAGRTRNLDGFVDIATVAGVEVYPVAAEVPMQFLADGNCGAVMIWTRRR